jgi:uncharacterized zinc-type alcohol dehydrogenase-like protein
MSLNTVSGYAAKAAGQLLEPFTYEPLELGEHEIRVSITHCGVCYTDIQGIEDHYGISTFPFVPGHEIVGTVSEVGGASSGLKKGDRVGIGWQGRSCMRCEWCLQGEEQLCQDIDQCGTWKPYGGFASSIVVDGRFAYPLPAAMSSETAAVLMCAGISVYNPLRTYAVGGGQKVGVAGVGGLGHLAIQFAHALGCEVTAISSSPDKKEQAIKFGADHFILSEDQDSMRQIRLSLDLLLYTSHGKSDWTSLLYSLKTNGRLAIIGFPDDAMAFDPMELVVHQMSISGSFIGSRATMKEMLSFAQAQGIVPEVEVMPMRQVNEALRRVRRNQARYRVVLVNDTVSPPAAKTDTKGRKKQ